MAATVVVPAALIAISLLPHDTHSARQATERAHTARIFGAPSERGPAHQVKIAKRPLARGTPPRQTQHARKGSTPLRNLTASDRRSVVARARAFVTAYLPYEIGVINADVRGALKRSATPSFARELMRHAPEFAPGDRPARGRVSSLELSDDPDAHVVAVAATISRGGRLSAMSMQLERRRDGWRVSRLL